MPSQPLHEISFDQVMAVSMSWSEVKSMPNYEKKLGELLFQSLFEIEPRAMPIFKFQKDIGVADHATFPMHAKIIVDMVDIAVNMLGPEMDALDDDLVALGRRHAAYKVRPEYLPSMGTALVHALTLMMKDRLPLKVQHAWHMVFSYMITKMSAGLRQELEERQ